MPILQQWDELSEELTSSNVGKRVIPGSGASLVRVSVPAGAKAGRHTHPFEQFVHVLSGRGMLETEDGLQAFEAGSVFHFLPGTWHAAAFDEDTILIETNLAE